MAERRYGGRRDDARGGGCGGGRGDLPNEEAERQRDLRDIENNDLRQQVRDLQRDIENGDLRRQVRHLQRRLARLDERRGKSNAMRSNTPERRSMDDPSFSDVFTSFDADESLKNSNSNISSMLVYDTPVYDEDIFYELLEPSKNSNSNISSMSVYDTPVYDEDIFYELPKPPKNSNNNIFLIPVYDKPVYDEDIFDELPGLVSKSPPPSVKFDSAAEEDGFDFKDSVRVWECWRR
ncbi:hypothetical protein SASPL_102205 [Salvia splendens]|uniref:Uncharacterized protein n=1 Tax=Salvia splendens TaxID=180675 RepID=A0A8X9ADU7_SALSN|nr:hypothetical protein SASPL_102205 [Salvia splendens]